MSIDRKLQEFETFICPNCKKTEMDLHNTLWTCYNCGHKMRQYEMASQKKYISKIKLKKYILGQFDENVSNKIIIIYLKKEGYSIEIFNNEVLVRELLMDLKFNRNFKTHKLFNLNDVINN